MAGTVSEVDICNFAYDGRLELVRASLERSPDTIKVRDSSRRSALHWACSSGKDDVVGLLISKGAETTDLSVRSYECKKLWVECERVLSPAKVDCEDDSEWTPLIIASSAGHLECVKRLVVAGASINSITSNGQTSLHYASSRNRLPIVKYLLSSKAGVNITDKYGSTPLHRAASRGNLEIVKLLVNSGADVNAQDSEGNTPLHLAADGGYKEVYDFIKSEGGRPDILNKEGKNAMDMVH